MENDISRLRKEHCPNVIKKTLEEMKDEAAIVKKGFECTGLMPFNPDAIDYNTFNKKKKRKSFEKREESQSESNDLELFEESIRGLNLLGDFQTAELSESGNGEKQFEGLFQYWLRLRKKVVDILKIRRKKRKN